MFAQAAASSIGRSSWTSGSAWPSARRAPVGARDPRLAMTRRRTECQRRSEGKRGIRRLWRDYSLRSSLASFPGLVRTAARRLRLVAIRGLIRLPSGSDPRRWGTRRVRHLLRRMDLPELAVRVPGSVPPDRPHGHRWSTRGAMNRRTARRRSRRTSRRIERRSTPGRAKVLRWATHERFHRLAPRGRARSMRLGTASPTSGARGHPTTGQWPVRVDERTRREPDALGPVRVRALLERLRAGHRRRRTAGSSASAAAPRTGSTAAGSAPRASTAGRRTTARIG